jgi:hypothetical protein
MGNNVNIKTRLKVCTYCGGREELTNDHIPPKNIFPKPLPENLITVPACKKCNKDFQKDEEYFRLKICLSQQTGNNSPARINRETIIRSLGRSEAMGFKNKIISDINIIPFLKPKGVIGPRLAYYVDLNRIFRVVEKTVKGLFFHETGQRLYSPYEVKIYSDDTLEQCPPDVLDELKNTIIYPLAKIQPKVIGNGIFEYRFFIAQEMPFVSVWVLTFFEQIPFLCITGK